MRIVPYVYCNHMFADDMSTTIYVDYVGYDMNTNSCIIHCINQYSIVYYSYITICIQICPDYKQKSPYIISKIDILFTFWVYVNTDCYKPSTPGGFWACTGGRGYHKELTQTKRWVTFFTRAKKYGIIKKNKGGMPFG